MSRPRLLLVCIAVALGLASIAIAKPTAHGYDFAAFSRDFRERGDADAGAP